MQLDVFEAGISKQGFGFIAGVVFGPARVDLVEDDKPALGRRKTHIDAGEVI
jgi:hypothetical protein